MSDDGTIRLLAEMAGQATTELAVVRAERDRYRECLIALRERVRSPDLALLIKRALNAEAPKGGRSQA